MVKRRNPQQQKNKQMIRDQVKCEKAPWSCVGGSGNQEELIHTQTKNVGSARDRAKAERRKFTMEKHRREREKRETNGLISPKN